MRNSNLPSCGPSLRDQFMDLLAENASEQTYQDFLERHTELIPREFVQNHGIHLYLILRKLPFGADYNSDFFYMAKSSDNWHLVFIEIEKPHSRFFRGNSNDLHSDFRSALQQIGRWRAWLSTPSNLESFLAGLNAMRAPNAMRSNPSYPRFVLVHGRRDEYHSNDMRRAIVRAEERSDFHILTFDSLAEGLAQKHECYVGARRNETIEIFGDRLVSPDIFGVIEPSQFKVTSALREVIRKSGYAAKRVEGGQVVDALPWVAERLRLSDGAGQGDGAEAAAQRQRTVGPRVAESEPVAGGDRCG